MVDKPNKVDLKGKKYKTVEVGEQNRVLDTLLKDRTVAHQSRFIPINKKDKGMSAGYVAKEQGSNKTFILKQFYKNAEQGKKTYINTIE
ncbi:hypothetical protein [Candidatus Tisiphia endosymbiont of Nemotelus uliginosus]|uniref:hypothetical protein n=1 Tax=Candidatus Tisiphia endosymbiont of Nemotelus uliginosus TaxID=3077926 RepID=UPI0035C9401B